MTVIVTYHQESVGLWAEVDALPTFSAAADDFETLRSQVFTALENLLPGDTDVREDADELGGFPTAHLEPDIQWGTWAVADYEPVPNENAVA